MPKNFVVESIKHHVLRSLERVRAETLPPDRLSWDAVCATFDVVRADHDLVGTWQAPQVGRVVIDRGLFVLYRRGDLARQPAVGDPLDGNVVAADRVVKQIGARLGLAVPAVSGARFDRERTFHDGWAESVRPEDVMVTESFEAATAPEHRFILTLLNDLHGKRLLDLGCGLGEAAVYFSRLGADVVACDLSQRMLDIVACVAAHHQVPIRLQCAPAESTGLPAASFDIVYAGNLLHHVDTSAVLDEIFRLLVPNGVVVTWDPLAHNPVINIYRRMAAAVRTVDEHPLRMSDLELFRTRFVDVRWRTFWLCTLAIFLRFFIVERVHPSAARYWKKILSDARTLEPQYRRLEKWDDRLLTRMPWLSRYCWNIVIWGRKPAVI